MKCPECGEDRMGVSRTVQTLKRCTRTLVCPACGEGFESEETISGRLGKLGPDTRVTPVTHGRDVRGSPADHGRATGSRPPGGNGSETNGNAEGLRGVGGSALSPDPVSSRSGSLEAEEPNIVRSGRIAAVTGYGLTTRFGIVRARHVKGALEWQSAGPTTHRKATDMAESLASDAEACKAIEPTMELLFRKAKAEGGDVKILKDLAWGFGTWCSQFTNLREELQGGVETEDDGQKKKGYL